MAAILQILQIMIFLLLALFLFFILLMPYKATSCNPCKNTGNLMENRMKYDKTVMLAEYISKLLYKVIKNVLI